MATDHCKKTAIAFFNCETAEESGAFTRVRISAEIALCERGTLHHFNTDEVKYRLEKAVAEAAWLCKNGDDPQRGADCDTADN